MAEQEERKLCVRIFKLRAAKQMPGCVDRKQLARIRGRDAEIQDYCKGLNFLRMPSEIGEVLQSTDKGCP